MTLAEYVKKFIDPNDLKLYTVSVKDGIGYVYTLKPDTTDREIPAYVWKYNVVKVKPYLYGAPIHARIAITVSGI